MIPVYKSILPRFNFGLAANRENQLNAFRINNFKQKWSNSQQVLISFSIGRIRLKIFALIPVNKIKLKHIPEISSHFSSLYFKEFQVFGN